MRQTSFRARNRPERSHCQEARSGTLGEAGSGPDEEPGQTANRIAAFGSANASAVERASDLRRINDNDAQVRDKRRRGKIAVEGLLRPTQP